MKKSFILISLSVLAGIIFTFFILNKKSTYALEEYLVYAFQVGAFESYDNAKYFSSNLPSAIIIEEDNLYKVIVAIYKDLDLLNEMIVYFEDNNINIYLKGTNVSKKFYELLDSYEKIIKNRSSDTIINKINQSILNEYLESTND